MFKIRRLQWAALAVVVLSLALAAWAYPQLPERVASHWNAAGQVNGYMSRFWGAFLMPIIAAVMWLMLLFLPKMDPRAKNIEKFKREFDRVILGLFVFLLFIFCLTLVWNLGRPFDMTRMIVPAIGLLFVLVGRMVMVAEPNFTAGIRTPWTLSSDTVWRKTHQLGGKLFMAAGLITLIGFFWPSLAFVLMLVPLIGVTVFSVGYSYYLYWQEKRAGGSSAGSPPPPSVSPPPPAPPAPPPAPPAPPAPPNR